MTSLAAARRTLIDAALAYPETALDHPWGEDVAKVRGKVFVFFGVPKHGRLSLSVKLPESGPAALTLPYVSPAGHGLGKSGWVQVRVTTNAQLDMSLLREWIDESYRAVAPRTLVRRLNPA